jgi:hypothetical protein
VCTGACGCIYNHDIDACTCECFDDDEVHAGQFSMGAIVSVTVNGLPLSALAGRFDRLIARDVLVPAARLNDKVTVKLRRVRLSAALAALGLVTRPGSQRPRASPTTTRRTGRSRGKASG